MVAGYFAAKPGQRGTGDRRDTQLLQSPEGPDHIHDGIQRADFVKMHLLQGDAVYRGLSLAQGAQSGHGPRLHGIRDAQPYYDGRHVFKMPQGLALGQFHQKLRAKDAIHFFFRKAKPYVEANVTKGRLQRRQFHAHGAKSREQHVSADPAHGIKVQAEAHGHVTLLDAPGREASA